MSSELLRRAAALLKDTACGLHEIAAQVTEGEDTARLRQLADTQEVLAEEVGRGLFHP